MSVDLGPILWRLDVAERRAELAAAEAVALATLLPAAGRSRVMVPAGGVRRVLAVAFEEDQRPLARVAVAALEPYARRHGWGLVSAARDAVGLASELLAGHDPVVLVPADAVLIDHDADLATRLDPAADVTAALSGDPGLVAMRAGAGARALLDAARDEALGTLLSQPGSPWSAAALPPCWDVVPGRERGLWPVLRRYPGHDVGNRLPWMLGDLSEALGDRSPATRLDVRRRQDLPALLNRLSLAGRGVEVGVRDGDFSAWILHRWLGSKLISVDPWRAEGEDYEDLANVTQDEHDELYERARHRFGPFGAKSEIWRQTSAEAAARTPSSSLDFVYLDARHDERSVAEDLELWFPAIQPGGVIAGHDYLDGRLPDGVFGVKSAVDRFFGARGLQVRVTPDDAPWQSWWVLVPGA
jgi:hypothetical protein